MRLKNSILTLSVLSFFLLSCEEFAPPIEFEKPVKGRLVNLSKKIGSKIVVKNGDQTATAYFTFQNDTNYIVDQNKDTIFKGTATKRNELFLLNRYIGPNRVLIHAVRLKDSLITGIGTEFFQTHMYKTFMDSLRLNHIVLSEDTNHVETVSSDKRENKEIFRMIIDNLPADTIIEREK